MMREKRGGVAIGADTQQHNIKCVKSRTELILEDLLVFSSGQRNIFGLGFHPIDIADRDFAQEDRMGEVVIGIGMIGRDGALIAPEDFPTIPRHFFAPLGGGELLIQKFGRAAAGESNAKDAALGDGFGLLIEDQLRRGFGYLFGGFAEDDFVRRRR